MVIYTLGHSNYTMEHLIEMIKKYDINCVVDIRAVPFSKYNVQFDKDKIARPLKEQGILYIYMGDLLGVKKEDKSTYINEGYSDFKQLIKTDDFIEGINRLKNGLEKGYKIALLGAVQDPIRCPRAILIGKYLDDMGVDVRHILHEGNTCSQREIEEMMLDKYYPDRSQMTIDEIILGDKLNNHRINECYSNANREIGFRIEHLK